MKRLLIAIVVVAAACGGSSSSPAAPSTTTTTTTTTSATAPTITGISPAQLMVDPSPQNITVTGTNFKAGLTVTVTPPTGTPLSLAPVAGSEVTATSFRLFFAVTALGAYSFQVANLGGERSNTLSATVGGSPILSFASEGVHLTEVSAGLAGQSIADSANFRLNDGRWRTLFTGAHQIRSAVSPDGLAMTIEPGIRIDPTALASFALAAAVKVLRLPDGRVRAYFFSIGSMYSAISTDEGLTFVVEPGVRLAASAIGDSEITGGSVVRLADGRWRMYFSGNAVSKVFSATSSDLLSWTLDPGVRIGPGAAVSGVGTHPCAIANANGSITVFYFRTGGQPTPYGLYASTSPDGLNFTTESQTGIKNGNDPDVVSVNGAIRMYYNWGGATDGNIYSARLNGSLTALANVLPGPILIPPSFGTPAAGRGGIIR